MAAIARQDLLAVLAAAVPPEAVEDLWAHAHERAGLAPRAIYRPEEAAVLGQAMLGLAREAAGAADPIAP